MDDKPDTAFVFDALPEGSIRLLRIAISEDDPASVDLHIQTVPLGVAPTFDALSYVWGPNPDRQLYHIRCTDETTRKTGWLPIVTNLLGAMPWLRVFSTVPIWIDAICINQKDTDEKARQIPFMGELYSKARQVIVWLGPDGDQSGLAMDVLSWIGYPDRRQDFEVSIADYGALISLSQLGALSSALRTRQQIKLFDHELTRLGLPLNKSRFWNAVRCLYDREWFRRLWTFQEIKLAKDAVVLCGGRSMTWSVFLDLGLRMCDTNLMGVGLAPVMDSAVKGLKLSAQNLRALRRPIGRGGDILADVINCSIGRECSIKEDRVYAFLGLVPDLLKQKIQAAYSQDPEHYIGVYHHFAKVLLEHLTEQALDGVLLAAATCSKPQDMPSWCPNWCAMYKCNPREGSGDAGSGLGEAFYQSDPSRDNILLVLGAEVDTVREVLGDPVWYDEAEVFRMADVFGSLQNILAWLNRCYELAERTMPGDRARHLDQYWRTICNVTSLDEAFISGFFGRDGLPLLNHVMELLRSGESVQWGRLPVGLRQAITGAIGLIVGLWANKVFLATEQGRIGCGTAGVQAGDRLCVLAGQPAIYCLRGDTKNPSTFTSRAFVTGLMEGEASQCLDSQDIHLLQIH